MGLQRPAAGLGALSVAVHTWDLSLVAQRVVSACNAEDSGSIPGLGDPLEKEMATHSSIPAWETPWTEDRAG